MKLARLNSIAPSLAHAWRLSGIPAHPRSSAGVAGAIVVAAGVAGWVVLGRRPDAAELERRRREALGSTGRLTDGVIVDARTLDGEEASGPAPEVLHYSYRLSGVVYHCAQDVSMLPEQVAGFRIDQPIQVRYDPRHPGNSILICESWSGLRR
jgi:hypothetical protein